MGQQKVKCQHCGAPMVEHRHSLNVGLVHALETAYRRAGRQPFAIASLNLDHIAHANFQKLAYWRLIEPHITPENAHKRGWWAVTALGESWLWGSATVQKTKVTYRGKVVDSSLRSELVHVHDVVEGYRYRGDYAKAARAPEHIDQLSLRLGGI